MTIPGPNCDRSPQQMVLPSAWTAHVLSVSAAIRTVADTPGTSMGVAVFAAFEPRIHGLPGDGALAQPQQDVMPSSLNTQACFCPMAIPAIAEREGTCSATGLHGA